jgi:hypothetical protein
MAFYSPGDCEQKLKEERGYPTFSEGGGGKELF